VSTNNQWENEGPREVTNQVLLFVTALQRLLNLNLARRATKQQSSLRRCDLHDKKQANYNKKRTSTLQLFHSKFKSTSNQPETRQSFSCVSLGERAPRFHR
jgi:hypothetical protein